MWSLYLIPYFVSLYPSLYDNVDSQHLDVDFVLGTGKSTDCLGFETKFQMCNDPMDDK